VSAPDLSAPVLALVLFAGVLHATWNAIAKAVPDKLVTFGLISLAFMVIGAAALPLTGLPGPGAIGFVIGSAVVHIGYDLALVRSYRLGAFNHTYPLARGTSPLLVAAGAWLFAGEYLDQRQIIGVLLVALGLMSIVFAGGRLNRAELPATGAALLTGCTIACYSLLDGVGVRHSGNAFGYAALLFLLQGPMFGIALLARRGDPAWRSTRTVSAGLAAGVIAMLAYGIIIWAQTKGALAIVSALRETSVVTAAIIAAVIFREPFGWRRIPAAAMVVAGIVMMQV
jgi:drug/metabolite transporter (DMT)-like permease